MRRSGPERKDWGNGSRVSVLEQRGEWGERRTGQKGEGD